MFECLDPYQELKFTYYLRIYLIIERTALIYPEGLFLEKTMQDFELIYLNDNTVEGKDFSCDKMKQRVFWKTQM